MNLVKKSIKNPIIKSVLLLVLVISVIIGAFYAGSAYQRRSGNKQNNSDNVG